MKNIVLTLSLFLGSCIYSMDQQPFVSSSSSPSACSADQEALTFEQMEKEREEKELQEGPAASQFHKLMDLDLKNKYVVPRLCSLGNGKLGILYSQLFFTENSVEILDVNSGKSLVIDPFKNETDFNLIPVGLCKLSENQMACILNSSAKDKKIKIYDVNSGKLLKDILITEKDFNDKRLRSLRSGVIKKGVYLPDDKMVLFIGEPDSFSFKHYEFIYILDLNTGKILHRFDILSLGRDSSSRIKNNFAIEINQIGVLADGSLILKSGRQVAIVSEIGEVNAIFDSVEDIFVLPKNELLSLDKDGLKIWKNEKYKFEAIRNNLNDGKLSIAVLQELIFGYLSKDWSSEIITKHSFGWDGFVSRTGFILNRDNILIKEVCPYAASDTIFSILNVGTDTVKNEKMLSQVARMDKIKILDDGKIIALYYMEAKKIEIWTNQPKVAKKEVQSNCIIC